MRLAQFLSSGCVEKLRARGTHRREIAWPENRIDKFFRFNIEFHVPIKCGCRQRMENVVSAAKKSAKVRIAFTWPAYRKYRKCCFKYLILDFFSGKTRKRLMSSIVAFCVTLK